MRSAVSGNRAVISVDSALIPRPLIGMVQEALTETIRLRVRQEPDRVVELLAEPVIPMSPEECTCAVKSAITEALMEDLAGEPLPGPTGEVNLVILAHTAKVQITFDPTVHPLWAVLRAMAGIRHLVSRQYLDSVRPVDRMVVVLEPTVEAGITAVISLFLARLLNR